MTLTYDDLVGLARRFGDDGRRAAERFLQRYNETHSHRPADYSDVTRSASYLIGLSQASEETE